MFFFKPFDTVLTCVGASGGCIGRAFLLLWELLLILLVFAVLPNEEWDSSEDEEVFVFAVLPNDDWDSSEDEEALDSFWGSCSIIIGIGFDECVDSEKDTDGFFMFSFFFFKIEVGEYFDCDEERRDGF
jgi:hypothetical protein